MTVVGSTLNYGAECWAMREEDESEMKATELRLLLMIVAKL